MGTVVEFLGENVSTVDFEGNMFYLDYEVLLLSFTDNFSRRLGCLRPYVIFFCPSHSMHGCHCRRQWVRRCQSCQYQRLGV